MAWQERLRESAYTPPGGNRIVFLYEDVSQVFTKKTAAFDFPDFDGTFIQDLGHTGRRYPLRVIFSGGDYDLIALEFMEGLRARGVGLLEHPAYGAVSVVPFGEIKRRDDLKSGGNQTIIEVTFWETIGVIFPAPQTDPVSTVRATIDDFNQANSEKFASEVDGADVPTKVAMRNQFKNLQDRTQSQLQRIADTQDDVRRQFNAINSSINNSLDIFLQQPLNLAFQSQLMIQSPGRALTAIKDRFAAFRGLTDLIIKGPGGNPNIATQPTKFHGQDLYASGYVSGSVVSGLNNDFETKTEAIESAEEVLDQFAELTEWRDNNYEALSTDPGLAAATAAAAEAVAAAAAADAAANPSDEAKQILAAETGATAQVTADAAAAAAAVTKPEVDDGTMYQQLQEAVALVAGYLVEVSFTLKQERSIVLETPRSIIDFVAEFYGEVDEQLDFFINSNNLTGSQILELPRGFTALYFV